MGLLLLACCRRRQRPGAWGAQRLRPQRLCQRARSMPASSAPPPPTQPAPCTATHSWLDAPPNAVCRQESMGLNLDPAFVRDITTLVGASSLAGLAMETLGQPTINGYFIAGSVIGPGGLNLVKELVQVQSMAQLGVQLLLFTLGLEFSVAKLRVVRNVALLGGLLQILACAALGGVAARLIGSIVYQGIFVGAVVSMSSTSIVIKVLNDTRSANTQHGQITIGTLILQVGEKGQARARWAARAWACGGVRWRKERRGRQHVPARTCAARVAACGAPWLQPRQLLAAQPGPHPYCGSGRGRWGHLLPAQHAPAASTLVVASTSACLLAGPGFHPRPAPSAGLTPPCLPPLCPPPPRLQDCMVGLLFAFMPVLSSSIGGPLHLGQLVEVLWRVLLKLAVLLVGAAVLARTVLPVLVRLLLRRYSGEVFQMALLGFCFVTSLLTQKQVGAGSPSWGLAARSSFGCLVGFWMIGSRWMG